MKLVRFGSVALALFALSVLPGQSAEEPYDVYAIISLTGPAAFVGRGSQITLGAVERLTNNTGGIRGRPLHFVIQDDQSSPATAVALASQVIAKKVPVMIGPGFGATCNAVLPLLANGPVAYCLSNAIHPAKGTFVFSGLPSSQDFAGVGLRYFKAKGVRKVALLTSTDQTGQDGEAVAFENLRTPEFKDMQVVANEHFGVTDLTVAAQMTRIKAAGAEGIDAWSTGPPFGTILRGIAESGWDGFVFTHAGNISKTQLDQYAQVIPRQLILTGPPMYAVSDNPKIRQARATFLDALHQVNIAEPDLTHFIAWDPAIIVVHALRQLGTNATAVQVRDYLSQLHDFPAVNGVYDFRRGDQRGVPPAASVGVRWDKNTHEFVTVTKPGGIPY